MDNMVLGSNLPYNNSGVRDERMCGGRICGCAHGHMVHRGMVQRGLREISSM